MNLSVDGSRRAVVAVVGAGVLLSGLAACSGESSSDDARAAKATTSATPAADQADDEAAVTDLVTRYWAASTEAQNSGDESADQFTGLAEGAFIETTLKSINEANADGVTRSGGPEVTEIEVVVTGDTADIRACLDENGWPFVKDGKGLGYEKRGNKPWGAQATRSGESWIITDVRLPPAGEKVCS